MTLWKKHIPRRTLHADRQKGSNRERGRGNQQRTANVPAFADRSHEDLSKEEDDAALGEAQSKQRQNSRNEDQLWHPGISETYTEHQILSRTLAAIDSEEAPPLDRTLPTPSPRATNVVAHCATLNIFMDVNLCLIERKATKLTYPHPRNASSKASTLILITNRTMRKRNEYTRVMSAAIHKGA